MKKIIEGTGKNPDIIDDYIANTNSLLIIPAANIEYQSIVEERNATYCVRKTPLEIIKDTIEKDFTTYEGRRKIIANQTGYRYKTPMILRMEELLFAFPTKTALNYDCSWIFWHPLLWIEKIQGGGAISFFNEKKFVLDVSYFTLQSQYNRTQRLVYNVGGKKIYD